MKEQIYDLNGAYELFKSYNGLGNENCIFYMIPENPIDFKTIAKGVVLGVALNAVGAQVIGVQRTGDVNNTNHVSGYLVNQTEYGIGLIPLQTEQSANGNNDLKIVPNSYIFIEQNNIKNIKIEQKIMYSLDLAIRIVTFEFANGQKETFRVYAKDKNIKYQESNFAKFMNRYGISGETKTTNKVFSVVLKIILIAIFVIPIIAVIIALSSINKDKVSSTNNNSAIDTGKIKVDKYNP